MCSAFCSPRHHDRARVAALDAQQRQVDEAEHAECVVPGAPFRAPLSASPRDTFGLYTGWQWRLFRLALVAAYTV